MRAGGGRIPDVVGAVAPDAPRARAARAPHHRRRAHLPAGVARRRALHRARHGEGAFLPLYFLTYSTLHYLSGSRFLE